MVLSGVLVGLLALFRDRFQQARLSFVRGQVLVAGLGDKGLAFVRGMRAEGAQVVAIDSDAANPTAPGREPLVQPCSSETQRTTPSWRSWGFDGPALPALGCRRHRKRGGGPPGRGAGP